MRIDKEPETDSLGMWQAYVSRGQSKPERRLRLSAVPIELQPQVKAHCETVFKLKARK